MDDKTFFLTQGLQNHFERIRNNEVTVYFLQIDLRRHQLQLQKTLFVKNDIVHRQQKSKRTGIRLKTQFRIPNSVIQETKIKYLLLSKQFSHLHAFSEFLDFKRLHGDNENVCNYLTKVNFRKERQMLLTIIGIGGNLCIAGNK